MENIKNLLVVFFVTFLWGCNNVEVLEEKGARNINYQSILPSQTVVFIHGMYLTPITWSGWEAHYQSMGSMGYTTFSPAWPLHDLPVNELNLQHPNTELGELGLPEILQHYRDFIATLEEKPILIGHSMGAYYTNVAVRRYCCRWHRDQLSTPQGIISIDSNFLTANLPHIDPRLPETEPAQLTFEQFQFGFVNDILL